MGIQSFLQAEKGDPDWLFSPDEYFGKQFKLSDANTIELKEGKTDGVTLRLNPTEKSMLAKHLRIDVRDNATMDLTILNEADDKTQQVFIYDIKIREGALLNLGIFAKGGKLNKHIFQINIEDGGTLASYGYISNASGGDTEVITKVMQEGEASLCTQLIGAHAGKNSQTVYQGMVRITADGEASEAGLESVNIISDDGGRCWSKPEVFSENITAKMRYGSQTSCIDSNIIQYLASKGLPHPVAESTVLKNFQKAIFHLIKQEDVREEVEQLFNTQE